MKAAWRAWRDRSNTTPSAHARVPLLLVAKEGRYFQIAVRLPGILGKDRRYYLI
jgi:hypothetical protein